MLLEAKSFSIKKIAVFATLALFLSVVFAALSQNQALAYDASEQGARDFANDFCPQATGFPAESRLADYLWVTAPDGTPNLSIVQGSSEIVPVKLHAFVTLCKAWPTNITAGARNIQLIEQNTSFNRLISYDLNYGGGPIPKDPGVRKEVYGTYDMQLDVSGWETGNHTVCTAFGTYVSLDEAQITPSPGACFVINFTRVQAWSITGQSYTSVNDTNVTRQGTINGNPGQTIRWKHSIRNNGPGFINGNTVGYKVEGFGSDNITEWLIPGRLNAGAILETRNYFSATERRYVVADHVIRQTDVGQTLCQFIASWPHSYNWQSAPPNWRRSAQACVYVPYNYNLTPSVTGSNGVVNAGSNIPIITPRVNNEVPGNPGATTYSPSNVEWQLKRVEVKPGGTIPLIQQQNASAPCAHFGNGGSNTCADKGSGTRTFPAGSVTLAALSNEVIGANTPVGTKICFTLSVRPYTQTSTDWRHSTPACLTVSKSPKMQVWGNDVRTRGKIQTGLNNATSNGRSAVFGSWVEYGSFSVGSNIDFASGSALNEGSTVTEVDWHKLTFANVNSSGSSQYGQYSLSAVLPTLAGQFTSAPSVAPPSTTLSLGSLASGTYKTNSNISLSGDVGQQDGKGKTIVIISAGTVTITGNTTYRGQGAANTFSSTLQLPQLVIIARDISIADSVTNVDAWLVASQRIDTCGNIGAFGVMPPSGSILTSDVCKNALTVNGPVAAQKLILKRTAGSDDVARVGDPAERFNLRPDTYLWAYNRSTQAGKAQTVYSTELPPRF